MYCRKIDLIVKWFWVWCGWVRVRVLELERFVGGCCNELEGMRFSIMVMVVTGEDVFKWYLGGVINRIYVLLDIWEIKIKLNVIYIRIFVFGVF